LKHLESAFEYKLIFDMHPQLEAVSRPLEQDFKHIRLAEAQIAQALGYPL
jgi:hypothetical protein